MKIRRRSRRTSSSTERQSTASQSRPASCGPFTTTTAVAAEATAPVVSAPNLPAGSGATTSSPHRLTRPASAPFRVGPLPVSGRLSRPPVRFPVIGLVPAAFRLPAFASRVVLSRRGSSAFLTVGLPVPITGSGPRRGFHVPHAPDTAGSGAAYPPGRRCSHDRSSATGRRLPLLSGQPCTPILPTIAGAHFDEESSAVHSRSPFRPSPHL